MICTLCKEAASVLDPDLHTYSAANTCIVSGPEPVGNNFPMDPGTKTEQRASTKLRN
jgi:hypothetical protein